MTAQSYPKLLNTCKNHQLIEVYEGWYCIKRTRKIFKSDYLCMNFKGTDIYDNRLIHSATLIDNYEIAKRFFKIKELEVK